MNACLTNVSSSKYHIQILDEQSADYSVIHAAFFNSMGGFTDPEYPHKTFKIEKVYRVVENFTLRSSQDQDCGTVLLFHGTKAKNVDSILQHGWRPSTSGCFGPGVYHSSLSSKCYKYAKNYSGNNDYYFFVNQVPLKYLSIEPSNVNMDDYTAGVRRATFLEKRTSVDCKPEQFSYDSSGSYINVGVYNGGEKPEYIASDNIVVAKYLVHVTRSSIVNQQLR